MPSLFSKALILHMDCGAQLAFRAPVDVCVRAFVCSVFHRVVPDYKCPLSPLFHSPLPWAGGPLECVRAQQTESKWKREGERKRTKKTQTEK